VPRVSDDEYTRMLQTFIRAAREVGNEILSIYNDKTFKVQFNTDNFPLTQADTASHRIIKQILSDDFPTLPLLSEEGKQIPYRLR